MQQVLNTPTGQLIIAAAVLDDVIALILLAELQARHHVRPLPPHEGRTFRETAPPSAPVSVALCHHSRPGGAIDPTRPLPARHPPRPSQVFNRELSLLKVVLPVITSVGLMVSIGWIGITLVPQLMAHLMPKVAHPNPNLNPNPAPPLGHVPTRASTRPLSAVAAAVGGRGRRDRATERAAVRYEHRRAGV